MAEEKEQADRKGKGLQRRERGPAVFPEDPPAPREGYWGALWGRDLVLSSPRLYGNFEEALDVGLNVGGGEGAAVAAEGLPLRPDEELLKVPGHV